MKIGESVKAGFKVAGGSMNLVLALFVFGAFWNLINVFLTPKLETPTPQTSALAIAVGLVFIFASIFVQAGSLGYVRDKMKLGAAKLSDFMSAGSKYYLRLLLLGLFIALVVGFFVLIAALAVALLAATLNALGIAIAVTVGVIGVYVAMLMFLAPYFIVVADQKIIASVKQSMAMVKKNLLVILGIILILIVIGFIFGITLGAVFALLSTAIPQTTAQIIFAVMSSFINAYLGLVVTGSFMNFYLSASNNNTVDAK